MEIYKASDLDFRIALRRFSLSYDKENHSDINDLSLKIARYRTLEEAEQVLEEILHYIDEGGKTIYSMPHDTVDCDENDQSDDVIKNALINFGNSDKES